VRRGHVPLRHGGQGRARLQRGQQQQRVGAAEFDVRVEVDPGEAALRGLVAQPQRAELVGHRRLDHPHLRAEGAGGLGRVVSAAVGDHHDLEFPRLAALQQAWQQAAKGRGLVECGNDDAGHAGQYQGRRATLSTGTRKISSVGNLR
jgi:hypothetical protein